MIKPPEAGGLFGREILTPSRLAARLQAGFDRDFGTIWVEGEIAELSRPYSGHAYFCLKEKAGGQEARIRAVMWKGRRPYAGTALAEGLSVLARGRLAVYAPRGDLQLVVDYLEPRGEGALRLAFEKLKSALTAEGLFEADRKRPLPYWPARVAVISSPGGAAVRDFIQTARARRPGAAISLYPVRVQGAESAPEIVAALEDLNAWGGFDLIVLTRGGGSLADLWSFNEEAVVRAVAASRTVVLAAIGHSTDVSLAELAADQRAITPTAAAEAVFRDQAALLRHLRDQEGRLARAVNATLARWQDRAGQALRHLTRGLWDLEARHRRELAEFTRRLGRFEDRLGLAGQRLDHLVDRLARAARSLIVDRRRRLAALAESFRLLTPAAPLAARGVDLARLADRLGRALDDRLDRDGRRLAALTGRLTALSPENILRRGYALVTHGPDRRPVTRASDLTVGEEIAVRLAEGRFISQVKDII